MKNKKTVKKAEETLFSEITRKSIPYESHKSDLLIPVTTQTTRLLNKRGNSIELKYKVRSKESGKMMYAIPFAFDPYYKKEKISA